LYFRVQDGLALGDAWGHWTLLPASFTAFCRAESCLAACREGSLLWLREIPSMGLKAGKQEDRRKGVVQLRV